MKVYKLFFQLTNAYKTQIIISFVLLLAVTIPLNAVYSNNLSSTFEVTDLTIGVINKDEGDAVTEHFLDYLGERAEIVAIDDNPEAVVDSLYNIETNYVIEIPENFGENLVDNPNNPEPLIKTEGLSDATAFAEVLIDGYFTNFQILAAGDDDLDSMLATLDETLANEVGTSTLESDVDVSIMAFGDSYTHLVAYIMVMTFISAFGNAIMSMRDPNIEMRNRMSKMTESSRVTQTLLACLTFALVYWGILMAAAGVMYGFDTLTSYHGLLLVLSSFVCMLSVTAMSYFFITISPNKGIVSFLSTFVSLFIAFTSGLFAPREFIGETLQNIASFAAPIWQVKADEIILSAQTLSEAQLGEVYGLFGIQLLIGAAYFAASFVVQKYRQMNNIYNA